MDDRWLDIREAAREVSRSPRTVRRWLDEGRLTAYRTPIARHVRVLREELVFLCEPQRDDAADRDKK